MNVAIQIILLLGFLDLLRFFHPLHYWKNVYSTYLHEWNGFIACSYWEARAWHPCDLTLKCVFYFLRRWAGIALLLSNTATQSNIFLHGFNEKTLCSMHCMHFLVPSICHSISGQASALAGCAWPFQSVITQSSHRTLYWSVLTRWSLNVKGFEFCNCKN